MNKSLLSATVLIFTLALSADARAQGPANPVAFVISCNIPTGQLTCTGQIALPAGERIVIEQVSARVTPPSGQTVQVCVSTNSPTLPSGSIGARHFLVLTIAGLIAMGWHSPTYELTQGLIEPADGSPNFYLDVPPSGPLAGVATLAVKTMRNVYGVRHPGELEYCATSTTDGGEIRFPSLGLKRAS